VVELCEEMCGAEGENIGGLRERLRRWIAERVGGGDDDKRKKKKKLCFL
jgi:hypothetical protein